jgi:hypothetical protein
MGVMDFAVTGAADMETSAEIERAQVSPAAERMRRHRARKRTGLRLVEIELHATEIEALVSRGYLERKLRNDPDAVRNAIGAFIWDALIEVV